MSRDTDERRAGGVPGKPKKSREERLAEALRANLRRRKSQARDRTADDDEGRDGGGS